MIPDDDSLRATMHRIEPAGADATDLFDRVAAGALARRRRTISVVSAAAVVVAVAALIPVLGHGQSSTRVNALGTATAPPSSSPDVTPPPTVSPPAVASSAAVVVSPRPPHPSTPPLITTGKCAGLTVAMSDNEPPSPGGADAPIFPRSDLAAEPSLNLLTVKAGSTVSFSADGPVTCVNQLAVTAAGTFPISGGSTAPGQPFVPLIVRPDGPGVETVQIQLKTCDAVATCTGRDVLAEASISVDPPASSTANPVSSNLSKCPTVLPLVPGADAAAQAKAAAVKQLPVIYPPETTRDFTVTAVYSASASRGDGKGYGGIAYGTCGKTIGDRTWVVEVNFPHVGSASIGNGQLFVSEFSTGWQVWYRYH